MAAALRAAEAAPTPGGDPAQVDLMEQHLLEISLVVHPGSPKGVDCPGCKAARLPGRIPCEPREEGLRLYALVRRQAGEVTS
jgi:hypothetical protein